MFSRYIFQLLSNACFYFNYGNTVIYFRCLICHQKSESNCCRSLNIHLSWFLKSGKKILFKWNINKNKCSIWFPTFVIQRSTCNARLTWILKLHIAVNSSIQYTCPLAHTKKSRGLRSGETMDHAHQWSVTRLVWHRTEGDKSNRIIVVCIIIYWIILLLYSWIKFFTGIIFVSNNALKIFIYKQCKVDF